MQLSENTINILKNYATINPSLLVAPGNTLTTMSVSRNIFAKATVEETFPQQFAIYELAKFLGIVSLFKDPELNFDERQVRIISGRQSVNYTYADPSMIVAPDPNKEISFPETAEIEFSISQDELQRVVRATGVLQLPEIAVIGNGHTITVTATNSKNPTADVFSIEVGTTDKTFSMYFKVENIIKLISNNYDVKINSRGISKWSNEKLTYFVMTEASSNYSG